MTFLINYSITKVTTPQTAPLNAVSFRRLSSRTPVNINIAKLDITELRGTLRVTIF